MEDVDDTPTLKEKHLKRPHKAIQETIVEEVSGRGGSSAMESASVSRRSQPGPKSASKASK